MNRKLLGALSSALLLVSMISACGSAPVTTTAPTAATADTVTTNSTAVPADATSAPVASGEGPGLLGVDKKFEGVTLRATFIGGGQYEAMYGSIKDWEAATGAKVEIVYKGDGFEIDKKLKTDFAANAGDYDIVWDHTSFFSQYIPFLEPLESYFTPEELADFSSAIINGATRDGHLWLIPRHADISVMHYRTDLFGDQANKDAFKAKFGYDLDAPTTWAQVYDQSSFFTGKLPGMYGTQFAGKEEALTGRFYEILKANGGDFFDDKFEPIFNNEAGVKTAEYFRDLYKNQYVPADTTSLLWDGVANNFCQGNVAIYNEWFGWYSYFEDPKNCKVAGKFDLVRQPTGTAAKLHSGWGGAHAFSVPKSSKNKEASVALIKFLTSPKIMYDEAKLGFLPVRESVWSLVIADAEQSGKPLDKKRLEIAQTAIADDFFTPPLIAEWIPFTNVLTPKLQAIILGDVDPKQGLDEAAAEARQLMDDSGYYK